MDITRIPTPVITGAVVLIILLLVRLTRRFNDQGPVQRMPFLARAFGWILLAGGPALVVTGVILTGTSPGDAGPAMIAFGMMFLIMGILLWPLIFRRKLAVRGDTLTLTPALGRRRTIHASEISSAKLTKSTAGPWLKVATSDGRKIGWYLHTLPPATITAFLHTDHRNKIMSGAEPSWAENMDYVASPLIFLPDGSTETWGQRHRTLHVEIMLSAAFQLDLFHASCQALTSVVKMLPPATSVPHGVLVAGQREGCDIALFPDRTGRSLMMTVQAQGPDAPSRAQSVVAWLGDVSDAAGAQYLTRSGAPTMPGIPDVKDQAREMTRRTWREQWV